VYWFCAPAGQAKNNNSAAYFSTVASWQTLRTQDASARSPFQNVTGAAANAGSTVLELITKLGLFREILN